MNSPGRGRVNGDPRTLHTVRGKVTPGYMHVPSRFWGNFLTRVHDMNPARLPIGARTTKVEADVVLVVVVKEDHCSALLAVDVDGRGGKVDKTGDAKEELVVLTEEEAIEEDNDPKRARGDGLVAVVVVGVYV